jgi:LysM repeat protein
MAVLMFVCFGAAYAAPSEAASPITYTVVKGDTLSAIAKKFPGTTWQMIAQRNNIAKSNLIYPNTVLTITQTHSVQKVANNAKKTQALKLSATVQAARKETRKTGSVCDIARGLDQMKYPTAVHLAFISASKTRDTETGTAREQIYIADDGEQQYVFQVSKHCVYTKSIHTGSISEIPFAQSGKQNDRIIVHISRVDQTALQQENTAQYSQAEEFSNIKHSLEEVLGPPYDLTQMSMAVLRHRQLQREAREHDADQKRKGNYDSRG